ncbi:MAG: hypothetical protein ABIH67_03355 [Candidatus Uhrbacteria bacterium]
MQIQDIVEGSFLISTTRHLTMLPNTEPRLAVWIPANTVGQVLKTSTIDNSILWAIEIMRTDEHSQQLHRTQLVFMRLQDVIDGILVPTNAKRCNRVELKWQTVNQEVWAYLHAHPGQAFRDFCEEFITKTEIELGVKPKPASP